MGNKFSRKRPQIDDRYTRPQGLYQHKDVDHKKLRRLIMDSKLAPCYPGAEDGAIDLDECPICFLHYPSLNRSKCCTKGICTECFLQVKSPHSARPTQCPFCKTPSYAVEYRGAKTQEEKGFEQAEEQKVIEAKIRIRRQQELQDEAARLQRLEHVAEGVAATGRSPAREETDVSGSATGGAFPVFTGSNMVDERSPEQMSAADRSWHSWTSLDRQAIGFPQANYPTLPPVTNDPEATWLNGSQRDVDGRGNSSTVATRNSSYRGVRSSSSSSDLSGQGPVETPAYRAREEDFDLDLEEIMLMEAIWLSIQEQGSQQRTENSSESSYPSPFPGAEDEAHEQQQPLSPNETRRRGGSVTGGFASAIAALAERQVAVGGPIPSRQPGPEESNGNASSSAHEAGTATTGQATGGAERFLLKAEKFNDDDGEQLDSGAVQEPGSVVASNLNRWMRESSPAEVANQDSIPSPSALAWEAPAAATDAPADEAHTDAVAAGDGPSGDAGTIVSPAAVPESYEEQIMLAMALSLAEAQGKRASTGEISEMS